MQIHVIISFINKKNDVFKNTPTSKNVLFSKTIRLYVTFSAVTFPMNNWGWHCSGKAHRGKSTPRFRLIREMKATHNSLTIKLDRFRVNVSIQGIALYITPYSPDRHVYIERSQWQKKVQWTVIYNFIYHIIVLIYKSVLVCILSEKWSLNIIHRGG